MSDNPDKDIQIRYRLESTDDPEIADDRRLQYREFVEDMIAEGSSESILDTLLMFVNLCETAPYRQAQTKDQMKWNAACAFSLRQVLKVMSNLSEHSPKPNLELEDQSLYYDNLHRFH